MAINEEIARYVEEERSRGVGEDGIRHALIAKGWEYQLVEEVIVQTRITPNASLFTPTFFRFAFGFITVIVIAVGLILVVGSMSQKEGGVACIVNCGK